MTKIICALIEGMIVGLGVDCCMWIVMREAPRIHAAGESTPGIVELWRRYLRSWLL